MWKAVDLLLPKQYHILWLYFIFVVVVVVSKKKSEAVTFLKVRAGVWGASDLSFYREKANTVCLRYSSILCKLVSW
jgi:hypothetical protein